MLRLRPSTPIFLVQSHFPSIGYSYVAAAELSQESANKFAARYVPPLDADFSLNFLRTDLQSLLDQRVITSTNAKLDEPDYHRAVKMLNYKFYH